MNEILELRPRQTEGAHATLLLWDLMSFLQVRLYHCSKALSPQHMWKGGHNPCGDQKYQNFNPRLSSKIIGLLGGEHS